MVNRWTESARAFMRATIRGGGERRISTRSKFYSLAGSLQRDHGMLSIERLVRRGRGEIELTFRVTEKGYQEFGGDDDVSVG